MRRGFAIASMARVNGVNVDEEFDEFKEENKRWTSLDLG